MEREVLLATPTTTGCTKCDREALTVTIDGDALCARHATIFMTIQRLENQDARSLPLPATTG